MLGLVHMVQQRTLRSHHEDAHYSAKNYKNLRHYDVMVKTKLVEAGCAAGVAFVSSAARCSPAPPEILPVLKDGYQQNNPVALAIAVVHIYRPSRAPTTCVILAVATVFLFSGST